MFSLQLVIMAGTVLLAYYFELTDTFGIHVQGFFCNDADLMKPYPGVDESSFIPPLILYCVVTAVPTTIVSTRLLTDSLSILLALSLSFFLPLSPLSLCPLSLCHNKWLGSHRHLEYSNCFSV